MPIDYDYLKSLPPRVVHQQYTSRDVILYALGIGAGLKSGAQSEYLRFVYEQGLVPLPTMSTILAYPGFWAREPKYGITWQKLLHRDQSVEIHSAIPLGGAVRGEVTIDEIYDRGAEKGALLLFSRRIFNALDDKLIATVRQVNVLRGDGGFGGPKDRTPIPNEVPARAPDFVVRSPTSPDQALLYRLSGDMNPLHADPAVAAAAGFERPILHGLASFGIAGLAVVSHLCGFDAGRLRRLEARFSSPVYPGDTFEVAIWRMSATTGAFEARVCERGNIVIRGYAELGE